MQPKYSGNLMMNIERPDEQAELMEAIKKADEDTAQRIEVKIPEQIVQGIDADVEKFRESRMKQAALAHLEASETLIWKADEPSPPKHKVKSGNRKYHGDAAEGYDAKREDRPKWQAENRIVTDMLSDLPSGTTVLDCPCGTGRFLQLYEEMGFNVICMDLSADMLKQAYARSSIVKNKHFLGDILTMNYFDITELPEVNDYGGMSFPDVVANPTITIKPSVIPDDCVDVGMMIRLTRWLSPEDCQTALRQLQRVVSKRIIFTARVRNHPHARGYDLINGALDGWRIVRDDGLPEDDDYRVIMLEPV